MSMQRRVFLRGTLAGSVVGIAVGAGLWGAGKPAGQYTMADVLGFKKN